MVLFFWCSNFTSFGPESCPSGSVLSIVPQGCCVSNDRTPSVTHRISTYLSLNWLSAGGWLTNSAYLLAGLLLGLDDQLAPGWSGMASSRWLGNSAVLHICFSSWGQKTGPDMWAPQPRQTRQTVQGLLRCLLVPISVTLSRHASEPTVTRGAWQS